MWEENDCLRLLASGVLGLFRAGCGGGTDSDG